MELSIKIIIECNELAFLAEASAMDDESEYKHLMPITIEVQEGKKYFWCSCGKSQHQPLCDQNNCGTKAIAFIAELTEEVCLCNCKHTKNPPFCDGSHARLLLEAVKNRQKK